MKYNLYFIYIGVVSLRNANAGKRTYVKIYKDKTLCCNVYVKNMNPGEEKIHWTKNVQYKFPDENWRVLWAGWFIIKLSPCLIEKAFFAPVDDVANLKF